MSFKVLLFDDEGIWIYLLKTYLNEILTSTVNDFKIIPFERFPLALEALEKEGPWNLLVTDLGYTKGVNLGTELVRLASKSGVSTIVVSVCKDLDTIDILFADYGILRFLKKSSFDHGKFKKAVHKVVFGGQIMEPSIYVPIIVEATKFIFSEAGNLLDKIRKEGAPSGTTNEGVETILESLSIQEINNLDTDSSKVAARINAQMASFHAYEIGELLKQIDLHNRNIIKCESQEAMFGGTPTLELMNRREHETDALKSKIEKLKNLLEKIYKKNSI